MWEGRREKSSFRLKCARAASWKRREALTRSWPQTLGFERLDVADGVV